MQTFNYLTGILGPCGEMKYIAVTGGVLSGLGKGIAASSIGRLLKMRGFKVTAIKIDPYLNVDAGTMNPYQHGEVFVLGDGGEVDLDLGNYERFLDENLGSDHNITTGKVYLSVINKERDGKYLGKTVQIIPHITDEIKERIRKVAKESNADITIIEVGGTVGDIESMPFLEALRQMHREEGGHFNFLFIHTTLVPILGTVGEFKTKPTQHSVKALREIGITPDIILARAERPLPKGIKRKISLFCDVPERAVISAQDVDSIYEVPLNFDRQGLTDYIIERMGLHNGDEESIKEWEQFVRRLKNTRGEVKIAIIGKYTGLKDSYISHREALAHCSAETGVHVKIRWLEAEELEKSGDAHEFLEGVDGIVIPGGFGKRGIEGKMMAIRYARENKIPFLGICLGFQLATIEFSRNVLGMKDANSTEFDKNTPYPVIDLLPEQLEVKKMGGTMRLGEQKVIIQRDSMAHRLYGRTEISERHRHRYEVNPDFIDKIEEGGFRFTGKDEEGIRMEIGELDEHPYFIATQFHPEFKSRPMKPAPVYLGLVRAAIEYRKEREKEE
jgi:CTP synthase